MFRWGFLFLLVFFIGKTHALTPSPTASPQKWRNLTQIAYVGYSVDLSDDGSIFVIGGPVDGEGKGAVWIYKWNDVDQQWVQQGDKLVGNSTSETGLEGISVSISGDGKTIAFGSQGQDFQTTGAWVATQQGNPNGPWVIQDGPINCVEEYEISGGGFQSEVALSGDGMRLAISIDIDQEDDGGILCVMDYNTETGKWHSHQGIVTASPAIGFSVAISSDGNVVASGNPLNNGGVGSFAVFVRNTTTNIWTQQGGTLVGQQGEYEGPIDSGIVYQGLSLALSANGSILIVGAPGVGYEFNDEEPDWPGTVWVFKRHHGTGNWTQMGTVIYSPLEEFNGFGYSVSVSADGRTFAAGAPNHANGKGGAFVYINQPGIGWVANTSVLVGYSPHEYETIDDAQGTGIGLSANSSRVIVGAFGDNHQIGAAYAFERLSNLTYVQQGPRLVPIETYTDSPTLFAAPTTSPVPAPPSPPSAAPLSIPTSSPTSSALRLSVSLTIVVICIVCFLTLV